MVESKTARLIAALAAVALIVVLFFAFSGDDESSDDPAPTPTATTEADGTTKSDPAKDPAGEVPVIEIKDGQPVGGVTELSFNKGDEIRFVVDSDTADEVHFHGYDVGQDVEAGGTVEFDVPADLEGIFEVELESTATPIAEITVNP
jgi:hypothetical protein